MSHIQLSKHLSYKVCKVIPVVDIWEHLGILLIYMVPIRSVHVFNIEAISGDTPALIEYLFPFGLVVNGHIEVVIRNGRSLSRCRTEIDNLEMTACAHENFLIVRCCRHKCRHRTVIHLHGLEVELAHSF